MACRADWDKSTGIINVSFWQAQISRRKAESTKSHFTNPVMSKTSFVLHIDGLSILDKMSDEMAGRFLKNLYQYKKTGIVPDVDFPMELAMTPFINQFIRDEEKYHKTVEKRALAGSLGGKQKVANASKSQQVLANLANLADKDKDKDKDKENVKEKEKENDVDFDFSIFENFSDLMRTWMNYKSSRNQQYTSQEGLNLFYEKLKTMSGGNLQKAREIINQSITANWSQIFDVKDFQSSGQNGHTTSGTQENGFKKGNVKFTPKNA